MEDEEPEYLRNINNNPSLFFEDLKVRLQRKYSEQKIMTQDAQFWGGISSITELEFLEFFGLTTMFHQDKLVSRQDFDKNYELIYAGCSETTGRLLSEGDFTYDQEEYVWGSYVSRFMGSEYLNISMGGASAYAIVSSLIAHINQYGPPKHLFVLFPQLGTRFLVAQDEHLKDVQSHRTETLFSNCGRIGEDFSVKYARKPFDSSYVISPTIATFYGVQSIRTLELVASLADINLIYSTWNLETDSIISAANATARTMGKDIPFKNYVTNPYCYAGNNASNVIQPLPEGCHEDLKSHDYYELGRKAHMGVHAQAHISEIFTEELTRRGYSASL